MFNTMIAIDKVDDSRKAKDAFGDGTATMTIRIDDKRSKRGNGKNEHSLKGKASNTIEQDRKNKTHKIKLVLNETTT